MIKKNLVGKCQTQLAKVCNTVLSYEDYTEKDKVSKNIININ